MAHSLTSILSACSTDGAQPVTIGSDCFSSVIEPSPAAKTQHDRLMKRVIDLAAPLQL